MRTGVPTAIVVTLGLGVGAFWYARQPHYHQPRTLVQAAREADAVYVYLPYEQPHEWYWSTRSALPETLNAIRAARLGPHVVKPDAPVAYSVELGASRWGPDGKVAFWSGMDGRALGSYRWPDGPSLTLSPSIAATFARLHDPAFAAQMAKHWSISVAGSRDPGLLSNAHMAAWRSAPGPHFLGRGALTAYHQFSVRWRLDDLGTAIRTPTGWQQPADPAGRAELRKAASLMGNGPATDEDAADIGVAPANPGAPPARRPQVGPP